MRHRLIFLSTLSLRRATYIDSETRASVSYFYPRSPCGERRTEYDKAKRNQGISIHALLAESDFPVVPAELTTLVFLSTLSLRRATISANNHIRIRKDFYPRSPCGERLFPAMAPYEAPTFLSTLSLRRATAGSGNNTIRIMHFYPRSPCGERPN